MAEEVHNPSEILPKAILLSVPIGTICGIIFLLPILFTLPDVNSLLQGACSYGGVPLIRLFLSACLLDQSALANRLELCSHLSWVLVLVALDWWVPYQASYITLFIFPSSGSSVRLLLCSKSKLSNMDAMCLVFGTAFFCGISITCVASRATWAFARDKAIPFHSHFSQISPHLNDVPVNALLLSTTIQVLLGLIYLGSSTAFNAFVGVAVMCLGAAYGLPVAISLARRRQDVVDAPFGLGRAGVIVNLVAVLWVMFAIVLFSMPAIVPVTQVTIS